MLFSICFGIVERGMSNFRQPPEELDELLFLLRYLPECDAQALRGRAQDLSNGKIKSIVEKDTENFQNFLKKKVRVEMAFTAGLICSYVVGFFQLHRGSFRIGLFSAIIFVMHIAQQFFLHHNLSWGLQFCKWRANDDPAPEIMIDKIRLNEGIFRRIITQAEIEMRYCARNSKELSRNIRRTHSLSFLGQEN